MEEVEMVLFTTHCPKCSVLKRKLEQKNCVFTESEDIQYLIELGIKEAPVLKVGEKMLTFSDAVKFVNELEAK